MCIYCNPDTEFVNHIRGMPGLICELCAQENIKKRKKEDCKEIEQIRHLLQQKKLEEEKEEVKEEVKEEEEDEDEDEDEDEEEEEEEKDEEEEGNVYTEAKHMIDTCIAYGNGFLKCSAKRYAEECCEILKNQTTPFLICRFFDHYRMQFVEIFSWSIPNHDFLREIAKVAGRMKCLEVGSGKGLYLALLRLLGVDIDGIDIVVDKTFTPVTKVSVQEVSSYTSDQKYELLFLCWPDYQNPIAYESLSNFKGNTLVYVGQQRGCTANDEFFDLLDREWELISEHEVAEWKCIYDGGYIYKRK